MYQEPNIELQTKTWTICEESDKVIHSSSDQSEAMMTFSTNTICEVIKCFSLDIRNITMQIILSMIWSNHIWRSDFIYYFCLSLVWIPQIVWPFINTSNVLYCLAETRTGLWVYLCWLLHRTWIEILIHYTLHILCLFSQIDILCQTASRQKVHNPSGGNLHQFLRSLHCTGEYCSSVPYLLKNSAFIKGSKHFPMLWMKF